MSTDETYLEAFIENLSTLPNEMKRNLAHIKTLDVTSSELIHELRQLESSYLEHVYSSISKIPVQSKDKLDLEQPEQGEEEEEKEAEEEEEITTSHRSKRRKVSDGKGDKSNQNDDDDIQGDDGSKQKQDRNPFLFNPKYGVPVKTKVNKSSSSSKHGVKKEKEQTILVVPTTEELNHQINNPETLLDIALLRQEARQLSEEKVSVAHQTRSLLDSYIKRLDADMDKFETLLKSSGQYQETLANRNAGVAKPDDLAAIQVTPNSPDWILAKVINHDPSTQTYQLADEDIESNKTFTLPESQVVILGIGGLESVRKGDVIYAVYPDTTSFYQATVVQGPKKTTASGESFVLVHFKDDGDEHGVTHDKAVLMKHIMRVPYGAM